MSGTRRKRLRQSGPGTGAPMVKHHNRWNRARGGWSSAPIRGLAISATILLAAAACGQAPSEKKAAGGTEEPLDVGISLPLTGDFSQPGGEARKGYEICRDQINKEGGLLGRQVELKTTDAATHQDPVVTAYPKLIPQAEVDLLLGTFSTLLNFPASAVAEKSGILCVEPAGGAPKMFDRGFKKLFF